MKYWPVPESFEDEIPQPGSSGSFWEDRTDRFNCGIDFYAPPGSVVLSITDGVVIDKGVFTDPIQNQYWNRTYFVVIKSKEQINYKYAELAEIYIRIGEKIEAGQKIGIVGKSLNTEMVGDDAPFYIRELLYKNYNAMLHLELYKSPVMEVKPYSEGNFLGNMRPVSVLDPNVYLMGISKNGSI